MAAAHKRKVMSVRIGWHGLTIVIKYDLMYKEDKGHARQNKLAWTEE